MKLSMVVFVACVLPGCAGLTPAPVIEAGEMTGQGLQVIHSNFENVVEGYDAKLREAYRQGLMAAFNTSKQGLVDADGKVNLQQYEMLAAQLAAKMDANEAWLDNEKSQVLLKMGLQFATVDVLNAKVTEYNKAAGVPPESVDQLLQATQDIAQTMMEQRQAHEQGGQPDVDFADIITQIGRDAYQQYLAQRAQPGAANNGE